MTETLLARITETRSRLQAGRPRLPQVASCATSAGGKTVGAVLSGQAFATVTGFLRAHGVAKLTLAERPRGGLAAGLFTKDNLPRLAGSFAPVGVAAGEAWITFKQAAPPSALELEDQCWKLYLDCACPEFGREIGQLRRTMNQTYPVLTSFFLEHLAAGYRRTAALLAGRDEFASCDAHVGVTRDLSYLAQGPAGQFRYLALTAALAGLAFNYALPFYRGHKETFDLESGRITQFIEQRTGADSNLKVVFERSLRLATACFQACYGLKPGHHAVPGELQTSGFGLPLWQIWDQHIREYFGGMLAHS